MVTKSKDTYSVLTLTMLDELVEKVGRDQVITKDEAERIFGGDHDIEVGDLTKPQLLQLALFEAYAMSVSYTHLTLPTILRV